MNRPTFDVLGFLNELNLPASVATTTRKGSTALAMMWFLVEDGRFWFHSPEGGSRPTAFLDAARDQRDVSIMMATFNPPDDIRQVRFSGPARIETKDIARVRRIYERYVPQWTTAWIDHAAAPNAFLWSVSPHRGMAVTYPGLQNQPAFRWSKASEFFDRVTSPTERGRTAPGEEINSTSTGKGRRTGPV